MEKHYELHKAIKSNKLCPFKVGIVERSDTLSYNWHENIEIILLLDGEGRLQYGADTLTLKSGEMSVINSGCIHRPCSDMNFIYLIIDESFCSENGISVAGVEFERSFFDPECAEKFMAVVDMMEKYSLGEADAPEVRLTVLTLLVALCKRHTARAVAPYEAETPSQGYVKRALAIINERYAEGLTLEGIANECGITKHHLAREFKKQTGLTVVTYLNIVRCKSASLSIADGVSITASAMECGFESLSYFSRTYKRIMGAPPSSLRLREEN